MDTARIIEELRAEKDRIERAISAFLSVYSGSGKRRGRPPKSASSGASGRRRRNGLTPAGRRKLSQMMKKRWAEYRKKQEAA